MKTTFGAFVSWAHTMLWPLVLAGKAQSVLGHGNKEVLVHQKEETMVLMVKGLRLGRVDDIIWTEVRMAVNSSVVQKCANLEPRLV